MTLLPTRHNFTIWKSATFRTVLTVYTGATENTPPRDLTNFTGDLVIRDRPGGTTLLDLNSSNGGVLLGGTAGTIQILITATQTAALTWRSGVYVLEITEIGADTDALLTGHFKVKGI